jgi:hypothetical protein
MDDKTKEKALTKEMKKTYGKERGLHGIIIKWISEETTHMETKLMACKLLRKCRKEEVPVGFVTSEAQCANDTMLSWAPYLLNMFLDDSKDVKDLRTKFHYSWLIIMIMLIGWKDPTYSYLCDWYRSLGRNFDSKKRSGNSITFARYLSDMQENISNTWRIAPEVVVQYQGISNFKAT